MNKNLTAILICLALTACQDSGVNMPKGSLWSRITSLWSGDKTPAAQASAPAASAASEPTASALLATSQPIAASQPVAKKSPGIEVLAKQKIQQQIGLLNKQSKQSGEDWHYRVDSQNIIQSDLNGDGITDYVVEAGFCEESSCNTTTKTFAVWVFTADAAQNIQLVADLHLDLDAKVAHISNDGIITVEKYEYAENDPMCCPSLLVKKSYGVVGKKLAEIAAPND